MNDACQGGARAGRLLIACGLAVWSAGAGAADMELAADTIVVTAVPTPDRVLPPQLKLDGEALLDKQPLDVADSLRGLPGVSVRTNSRGETIARVRGADERQTAVFFDGAPLGVPWDGRVDLAILPAGLIGEITVTKGAVPIEYGANAVAGVVDLTSRRGGGEDRPNGVTALLEAGTYDFINTSAVATVGNRDFDVTLAGGYVSRDAVPVADIDALPFSQPGRDRRINTDLESFSVFAAGGARLGPVALRLSVLHNDTERGIAPESDRDPAVTAPRYWRYPLVQLTQINLNARAEIAENVSIAAVLYRQWFDQIINNYRAIDYAALRTVQDDDDNTKGARLTFSHPIGPATLRWSGSVQESNHKQVEIAFPARTPGPRLEYEQRLYTAGVEADVPITDTGRLTFGVAYDRSETPLTGDKPDQPTQDAVAFSASFQQALGEELTLKVAGGRRTRFATLRELYGEALGRFLLNPGLRPERAWLLDAEVAWRRPGFALTLNPFYVNGDDTLSQRIVRVGGQQLRQRFNLSGTVVYGVDATATVQLADGLDFAVAGAVLKARAEPGDAAFRRLVQRPSYELNAVLGYELADRFRLEAEVLQIGDAVDLAPDGGKARLPSSTEINLRGRATLFRLANGQRVSFTAAGDNLFNDVVTPQLGLPAPGRIIRLGIRLD